MRRAAVAVLGLFIAALAGQARARSPVVVELFTSQGCSSCVKSGQLIGDLGGRPHVLALTFAVDYWDYLGWADTFAKPEFTQRQRDYAEKLAVRDVYTPQVVVNGRLQAAALNAAAIDDLVKRAGRQHVDPPDIDLGDARVAIGYGKAPSGGADVWLVRYDPGEQSVAVKRGENRGRTVVEHDVVRDLIHLGTWKGRPKAFRLPRSDTEGLKSAVIVQAPHGGRILAAAVS